MKHVGKKGGSTSRCPSVGQPGVKIKEAIQTSQVITGELIFEQRQHRRRNGKRGLGPEEASAEKGDPSPSSKL